MFQWEKIHRFILQTHILIVPIKFRMLHFLAPIFRPLQSNMHVSFYLSFNTFYLYVLIISASHLKAPTQPAKSQCPKEILNWELHFMPVCLHQPVVIKVFRLCERVPNSVPVRIN